jgi:glutathione synthase/RimK-type ligase-like ATP-grasp enzyme
MGARVLKLANSSYVPREGDVVVNWGNTSWTVPPGGPLVVNLPTAVVKASNKKSFFLLMRAGGLTDVIPEFWLSQSDIPGDVFPVVCRTVLAGHSGEGIVMADSRAQLVQAPLYVKYQKKQHEYRVHVGRTYSYEDEVKVIAVQRKARRIDCPTPNWKVRNLAGGFIYARQDVEPPAKVIDAAKRSLLASGLDFGAVDVIYNAEKDRPYVLEINTAPGLEGQTISDYADFFSG